MSARAVITLTHLTGSARATAAREAVTRLAGRPVAVEAGPGVVVEGVALVTDGAITVGGTAVDAALVALVMDLGDPDNVPWAK